VVNPPRKLPREVINHCIWFSTGSKSNNNKGEEEEEDEDDLYFLLLVEHHAAATHVNVDVDVNLGSPNWHVPLSQ
jgi:hypothetical protein